MSLDQAELGAVREVVREEIRAALRELVISAPAATPPPGEPEWLSVADVLKLLPDTVTPEAVCAWCRSGKLAAKKVGRGWMIKRAALDRFLSTIAVVSAEAPDPEREAARVLTKMRRD